MNNLLDSLMNPPTLVDPLTAGGIIGHVILLMVGAVVVIGTAITTRFEIGVGHVVASAFGGLLLLGAEFRFFRATSPDAHGSNVALWCAFLLLPLAAAITLMLMGRTGLAGGAALAVTGGAAAALAGFFDHVNETLAAIPLSLIGALALTALIVMVVMSAARN